MGRVEARFWASAIVPEMVVHWDVWGSTAELLDAGARLLASRTPDTPWDVLADPEGNEFCVFTRDRGRAHRHRSGLARAR